MINLGQINKIFLPQLWPQFHLKKMRWPQFLEKEFLNQVLGLHIHMQRYVQEDTQDMH